MSSGAFLVVRRILDDDSRMQDVIAFIERIALEREGATPPEAPQVLFVAYEATKIVATTGLDFGTDEQPLPLEEVWEFDRVATPLPFERTRIAQYGRWMAEKPGVSAAVSYTATRYAETRGKRYGIFEIKPPIAHRMDQLGLELFPIEHATLRIERVPESGLPYYASAHPPALYMIRLAQVAQALQRYAPSVAWVINEEPAFVVAFRDKPDATS